MSLHCCKESSLQILSLQKVFLILLFFSCIFLETVFFM